MQKNVWIIIKLFTIHLEDDIIVMDDRQIQFCEYGSLSH